MTPTPSDDAVEQAWREYDANQRARLTSGEPMHCEAVRETTVIRKRIETAIREVAVAPYREALEDICMALVIYGRHEPHCPDREFPPTDLCGCGYSNAVARARALVDPENTTEDVNDE